MALDPRKFDIETWLDLENNNSLQKICEIFDDEGRLVEKRATRVYITPAGTFNKLTGAQVISAPCLRRFYWYDQFDNVTVSVPDITDWTHDCEEMSTGSIQDPSGAPSTLVPRGKILVPLLVQYEEITNIPEGVPTLVLRTTVQPEAIIYVRSLHVSGDNRATFTISVDGDIIDKARLWWTSFNNELLFDTADGGIILGEGSTVEIHVTNTGEGPADFNARLGYTEKKV